MGFYNASKNSDIGKSSFSKPISNKGYIILCFLREPGRKLVKNDLIDRQQKIVTNPIYMIFKMDLPQEFMVNVNQNRFLWSPFPSQNREFGIKTQRI